jgi:hypothetical protein
MKKTALPLIAAVFVVFGCGVDFSSLAVPESVTIKGEPGLHIPLGSPFGDDNELLKYLSRDGLKEKMGGDVEIYDFKNDGPIYQNADADNSIDAKTKVQTYIIRYPITKLNLDLTEYMKNDIEPISVTIPSVPSTSSLSTDLPPIDVPLGDMEKLLTDIAVNDSSNSVFSSIIIKNGASLKDKIELKADLLGITTYSRGQSSGKDLKFMATTDSTLLNTSANGKPANNFNNTNKIVIETRLVQGPISGGVYSVEIEFQWKEAKLKPGDNGKFSDKYKFDTSGLTHFLGNAEIKNVPAYLYIGQLDSNGAIPPNNALDLQGSVDLTAGATATALLSSEDLDGNCNKPFLVNGTPPSGTLISAQISESSFPISGLTNIVNGATTETTLNYSISIDEMPITNGTDTDKTITVDLVILLPFDFKVKNDVTVSIDGGKYAGDYTKLNIGELKDLDLKDDLFGRKDGNDSDYFKSVKSATIILENINNTVIGGLLMNVVDNNSGNNPISIEDKTSPRLSFNSSQLNPKFTPKFQVLVKQDTNSNAYFKVKPFEGNAQFDFTLAVEAQAEIEYTQKF